MGARKTLDALLVEHCLFESRSKASASVIAGEVRLGPGRERAAKPGMLVPPEAEVEVDSPPRYVSRGGLKLERALACFDVSPTGRLCLDVGASTGGFTDCLLQGGAAHVVALDVAYGELHWSLRQDPRVTVIERANARSLDSASLPYAPDMVTIDVSFISLEKVLPAVLDAAAPQFDCLALVKPQFEVGRERLGKGGVVRDADTRRDALVSVGNGMAGAGFGMLGFASSELPGPAGNRESFVWLAEAGRDGSVDVEAAAAEVEP